MSGVEGEFSVGGRTFNYEITEVITEGGNTHSGREIEDDPEILESADQIFYKAEADDGSGEIYWRWIGGPFVDIDDVVAAIGEEVDVYESVSG